MMRIDRKSERLKRRLSVKAHTLDGEKTITGMTRDISPEGMFIETSQPLPIGNPIKIEVIVGTQTVHLEGTVVQANRSAHQLQSVRVSGMGVSGDFGALQTQEVLGERRQATRAALDAESEIFFGSEKRAVSLQDLSASGAAVRCDSPLPPITFVRVNFKFDAYVAPITLDGVQVRIEEKDGTTTMALQFLDPPAILVAQIENLVQEQADS
jgi:hypothetical protein